MTSRCRPASGPVPRFQSLTWTDGTIATVIGTIVGREIASFTRLCEAEETQVKIYELRAYARQKIVLLRMCPIDRT